MALGGRINSPHIATSVADESVDSDAYVDGSIDLAHMSDESVDSDQYVDGSIDAAHIASNAVTTAKINADAVTGAKIADNAIDSEHYTDGSIDTAHLAADAVDGTKIADDAIDSEHYTDGSIDNAHIADDAIDSEHYAAGSIDTAHIADNQVTVAKLADIARGSLIIGNASAASAELTVGSDNYVLTVDGNGDIGWEAAGGGGDVVDDSTPQLGGDLDANGSDITGIGHIGFLASQAASGGANDLDDYEEGTFTPLLQDASYADESQSYSYQVGSYTKIGQRVFINIEMSISSVGSLSDAVFITGLPFNDNNTTYARSSFALGWCYSLNFGAAGYSLVGSTVANTDRIQIFVWDGTGGTSYLTISELSDGARLAVSGNYLV